MKPVRIRSIVFDALTVNVGDLDAGAFYERLGFGAVEHPSVTHVKRLAPEPPGG